MNRGLRRRGGVSMGPCAAARRVLLLHLPQSDVGLQPQFSEITVKRQAEEEGNHKLFSGDRGGYQNDAQHGPHADFVLTNARQGGR